MILFSQCQHVGYNAQYCLNLQLLFCVCVFVCACVCVCVFVCARALREKGGAHAHTQSLHIAWGESHAAQQPHHRDNLQPLSLPLSLSFFLLFLFFLFVFLLVPS